jgi:UDP-3-O-[3-hydroxymyristoyl] glucosamine N-acyltransferase
MMRKFSVGHIAAHVRGSVSGDPERQISGVNTPNCAGPEDLIFIDSPKHLGALRASAAGAAIVPEGVDLPADMSGIRVAQPAFCMALAVDLLVPDQRTFEGTSPQAALGRNVDIGPGVGIGPQVYVGDSVKIGRGTEIHPGTTIGRGTIIGEGCRIYSGVHIYHETIIGNRVVVHSGAVIGADGFGYVGQRASGPAKYSTERLYHHKVRQVGRVIIEDDVEIGANSAVDRAALAETRIGAGTKIDNLVTIGHNSVVGRHCIIIGQAGISGSVVLGDHVTIAGQAGLTGHLHIGSRAVIGAQAGVTKDVLPDQVVLGAPAVDAIRAKRAYALIDSLPEFKKALATHERRIARLEEDLKPSHEPPGSEPGE